MSTTRLPYPQLNEGKYGFNPQLTKDDPGSHFHLLYVLAQQSGLSHYHLCEFVNFELARKMTKPKDLVLVLKGGELFFPDGMRNVKGGGQVYTSGSKEVDVNYPFEHVYQYRLRAAANYGVGQQLTDAGPYKECQGGGWHSNTGMLKFENNYYADLGMSSGVRYEVLHSLGLMREQLILNKPSSCSTNVHST